MFYIFEIIIIYWYDKPFIIAILKLMLEKNIYKMYIVYFYTASFKKKDKWFNCKFDHNIFVYFIFMTCINACLGFVLVVLTTL